MPTKAELAAEIQKSDALLGIAIAVAILKRLAVEDDSTDMQLLDEVEGYFFRGDPAMGPITEIYAEYALDDAKLKQAIALRFRVLLSYFGQEPSAGRNLMLMRLEQLGLNPDDCTGMPVSLRKVFQMSIDLFSKARNDLHLLAPRFPEVAAELEEKSKKLTHPSTSISSAGCLVPFIIALSAIATMVVLCTLPFVK